MTPVGHVAAAYVTAASTGLPPWPVVTAAVFPDVVDKAFFLSGKITTGRLFSHCLVAMLATTGIVMALFGALSAAAWFLGYTLHMLLDLETTLPWFYFLKKYPPRISSWSIDRQLDKTVFLETILVFFATLLFLES